MSEPARSDYWDTVQRELCGTFRPHITQLAIDRNIAAGRAERIAVRWLDGGALVLDYTYSDLQCLSRRVAGNLHRLGIAPGTTVASLCGWQPELFAFALGAWQQGAVFCPLFAAAGPEPLYTRLQASKAAVLITTSTLYQRRVAAIRHRLSDLRHVVLLDEPDKPLPETLPWSQLTHWAAEHEVPEQSSTEAALLHFTSGTTGTPKGALHDHAAVIAQYASARSALDLQPGTLYWCTAEPGWVTATVYGLIAPLVCGATAVVDSAGFHPERWRNTLREQRIEVWYTTPTALRLLMTQAPRVRASEQLRLIASVGEPLHGDVIDWARVRFGQPVHDTWWQTETGAIVMAGTADRPLLQPLPGAEVVLLQTHSAISRSAQGELAVSRNWPGLFRGYLNDPERYRQCFTNGWYRSGDLMRHATGGGYRFVGRNDDLIKSAGHLIGPAEVERELLAHHAVAEAAAFAKPDPIAGSLVKAGVVLKPGIEANSALQRELLAYARCRLGPSSAPREIEFLSVLPKTPSGKIMRRLLSARETDQGVTPSEPKHPHEQLTDT